MTYGFTKTDKFAFTMIEILVVITIIALLAGAGLAQFSYLSKSSRDARRKADIENIRGGLELYRSNNGGSYPSSLTFNCPPSGALADTSNTYLSPIPNDPKCLSGGTNKYTYSVSAPYQTYSLWVPLESGAVGATYAASPYGSQ
ncbi:prepilin-type N-terminal cleavage/methylation domain-containing protein [Candidatus Roizmanbacteria bacterium]|nr:prepilin-type N-terminal cleavage/methylation domain-containing protein [Candidatus Roizmanbacteria bacterium]